MAVTKKRVQQIPAHGSGANHKTGRRLVNQTEEHFPHPIHSPTFAAETQKVRWNQTTTWNSALLPLATPPVQFAQMVSDMTGGHFIIKVEGAEKHKAPLEILDMVKGGQYEMGYTASYYWKGKDVTNRPVHHRAFGMTCQRTGGLALLRRRSGADAAMLRQIRRLFPARRQYQRTDGRLVPQGNQVTG